MVRQAHHDVQFTMTWFGRLTMTFSSPGYLLTPKKPLRTEGLFGAKRSAPG